MSRHSIGFQTAAAAANAAYAAFRAPNRSSRLLEFGLSCNAATASNVSLFRNTSGSYVATGSTSAGQSGNPLWAAGTSLVDTAWSGPPTVTAASRIRRFGLPATIGAGFLWVFENDEQWVRSANLTDILVLWNEGGSAGSVLNGWARWEE